MSDHAQIPSTINNNVDIKTTATFISLEWEKPTKKDTFEYFEIQYKEEKKPKKNRNKVTTEENKITFYNLKSDTSYALKGFIITENERNQIFDEVCNTKPSSIPDLMKISTKVSEVPPIYKLPFAVKEFELECLRECYVLGDKYRQANITDESNEKTILVVGATGSGKSTLIDAMINHVVDVAFQDKCRFKIIDLTVGEKKEKVKEVDSTTSTTTCYRIPRRDEFSINFALNIVDTPGFDDTRSNSFDKEIPKQIRKLFENVIHKLHAVCVVVPLSCNKFTETHKSVFSNILKIFGTNIKNIIYPCITHDDGGGTVCLSTLEAAGVPFEKHFRFKNADLFSMSPTESNWNERKITMSDLFSNIGQVQPQSLKSSEEVLKARENITIKLESIQDKIRIQVQLVNTIKNEDKVLRTFESEIESNKDFTYNECVPKKVKSKSRKIYVNCKVCQESCHKNCNVPFDIFLYFCEAFSKGRCTVCKALCPVDSHERQHYEIETVFENKTRTKEDLEKKYRDAVKNQEMQTSMIANEREKLKISLQELVNMLKNVEELIKSLNKIALKRENFTVEKYLDELIDLEETKKNLEYSPRVEFIKKIKNAMKDNKPFEDLLKELSI